MKRVIDFIVALVGLIAIFPILLVAIILIILQDFHSPFYLGSRVGKGGRSFNMVKLRSMLVNAHKSGVESTSASDPRITSIGHFIRRFKLDELPQLWNVLKGDMSLVGPRPNVKNGVDLYTEEEMKLISVRPGITDLSSIVFSDEGSILEGSDDPDLKYDQVIRPWKSRLGILYVDNMSVLLDLKIIFTTVLAILDKQKALKLVNKMLIDIDASDELKNICLRQEELHPHPPPGSEKIVQSQ